MGYCFSMLDIKFKKEKPNVRKMIFTGLYQEVIENKIINYITDSDGGVVVFWGEKEALMTDIWTAMDLGFDKEHVFYYFIEQAFYHRVRSIHFLPIAYLYSKEWAWLGESINANNRYLTNYTNLGIR